MKNIHGIGRPSSTNIGSKVAKLNYGTSIITVRGLCGEAVHVSEGVAPNGGLIA